MTETLRVAEGRSVLRIERRLAHPPAKVWRAVTDPAHLVRWFPFRVEVDLRIGGEIRFLERDCTLLVFTHRFTDHYGHASFTAGWHTCFDALDASLDGRLAREPGDMAAAHDRYVVAFGLDEGTVSVTPDGWQVRFERQLTKHADHVWPALTGGDAVGAGGAAPTGFVVDGLDVGAITAGSPPALSVRSSTLSRPGRPGCGPRAAAFRRPTVRCPRPCGRRTSASRGGCR